jgi:hypothetical protein
MRIAGAPLGVFWAILSARSRKTGRGEHPNAPTDVF